ncbi:MAG: molybdopterin-guanine dinucleotide biosynthesis protein [Microbacteriaceae bacterium]|nr:molybdopterin-guanine dinucleotide biosynthesis protein [Microbacteriaceae bacterium]
MNDQERVTLEAFAGKLAIALDLGDVPFDIDQVLDLAGDAARTIVRPAAPLTTFLVGYAAGRSAAAGTDPAQAISNATDIAIATAAGNATAE